MAVRAVSERTSKIRTLGNRTPIMGHGYSMRAVFLFFLGLILGACARPVPPVAPTTLTSSHEDAAQSLAAKTTALVGYDEEGGLHVYCTGVWVGQSEILTAHHCVADLQVGDGLGYVVRSDIYTAGNERQAGVIPRAAYLAKTDEGHDLALLRAVLPPTHSVAALASGPVRQGAFAQSMGHPLGLWWSYSNGSIAAVRQIEINGMDLIWVQGSVPISPGNSGGGLFDESDRLIGIAHASFASPRAQLLNVFVHRDYIGAFLQGAR